MSLSWSEKRVSPLQCLGAGASVPLSPPASSHHSEDWTLAEPEAGSSPRLCPLISVASTGLRLPRGGRVQTRMPEVTWPEVQLLVSVFFSALGDPLDLHMWLCRSRRELQRAPPGSLSRCTSVSQVCLKCSRLRGEKHGDVCM